MVFAIYEQGMRIHTPREQLLRRPAIRQTQATSGSRRLVDEDGKAEHFQDMSDQTWAQILEKQFSEQENPEQPSTSDAPVSKRALDAYNQASAPAKIPTSLKAEQIMRSPVITISAQANLNQAWQLMQQEEIHYLVLLDAQEKFVGIIDDRQLLKEAAGVGPLSQEENINLAQTYALKLVSAPPVTASLETDIRDIARVMLAQKIRAMPILDAEERIQGLVTRSDLMLALVNKTLEVWS